jgi:hypothetical protein
MSHPAPTELQINNHAVSINIRLLRSRVLDLLNYAHSSYNFGLRRQLIAIVSPSTSFCFTNKKTSQFIVFLHIRLFHSLGFSVRL